MENKAEVINQMSALTNPREVQVFLGTLGYY